MNIMTGSFVVLRLDPENCAVQDYAWVQSSVRSGRYIWLSRQRARSLQGGSLWQVRRTYRSDQK